MNNPFEKVPPEKAKELFDKMREVVDDPVIPEVSKESTEDRKPTRPIQTGAGAMFEWQREREEEEDKRHVA
ncbi:MAG: hypothetical protein AAB629_01195 [Patescibacteria group bacterium]